MREEKENDDKLRAEFKEKWNRVPSENLTLPLAQEMGKYRQILATAAKADGIVSSKFQQNLPGMEILSRPEVACLVAHSCHSAGGMVVQNELKTSIPDAVGGAGQKSDKD